MAAPNRGLGTRWASFFDKAARDRGDSEAANAYLTVGNFRFVRDNVLAWLGPVKGASVLDVGCGTGHFTLPLAGVNFVAGLDLSAGMLGLAGRKGLSPVRASAERLPFPDGAFALVLANNIIQLMPDGPAFVRELVRVAKPGGRVVVTTINGENGLVPVLKVLEPRKYRDFLVYSARGVTAAFEAAGGRLSSTLFVFYPFGAVRVVPAGRTPSPFCRRTATSVAVQAVKVR